MAKIINKANAFKVNNEFRKLRSLSSYTKEPRRPEFDRSDSKIIVLLVEILTISLFPCLSLCAKILDKVLTFIAI